MTSPFLTYMRETFLEVGDGFHFSSPPPTDVMSERFLHSDDSWEVLACVLARCQRGDFDAVSRLPELLRRDDSAVVWNACCQLIGFAGGRRMLEDLAGEYAGQLHTGAVQYYVSSALVNGCGLWSVPHLLAMHGMAANEDARVHLAQRLSLLLEQERGPVWRGPVKMTVLDDEDIPEPFRETRIELDEVSYRTLVLDRVAELQRTFGNGATAFAEGEPFELQKLAHTLLRRVNNNGMLDRIEWERMVFEATTGWSCSALFDSEYRLQRLAAAARIEEFLDSGEATRYVSGARYFFGHRVPD